MRYRIITGGKGSGKTTRLLSLSSECRNPSGYASVHRDDEYFLLDLSRGEERLLMTSEPRFSARFRRWYYDESLFSIAEQSLMAIAEGDVFLDEIGLLELEGKGFSRALRYLLTEGKASLTITARDAYLESVISYFSIPDPEIIRL